VYWIKKLKKRSKTEGLLSHIETERCEQAMSQGPRRKRGGVFGCNKEEVREAMRNYLMSGSQFVLFT
jgi:hypothetical protein